MGSKNTVIETDLGTVSDRDLKAVLEEIGLTIRFVRVQHSNGASLVLGTKTSSKGSVQMHLLMIYPSGQRYLTASVSDQRRLAAAFESFFGDGKCPSKYRWRHGDGFQLDHEMRVQPKTKSIYSYTPVSKSELISNYKQAQEKAGVHFATQQVAWILVFAAAVLILIGISHISGGDVVGETTSKKELISDISWERIDSIYNLKSKCKRHP